MLNTKGGSHKPMAIKKENYGIVAWLLIVGATLLVGSASSWFGLTEAGPWYQQLSKPALTPRSAVFPIAWTVLFVLMGWSAWLVHRTNSVSIRERRQALELYALQLFVNAAWPIAFFTLQQIAAALVVLLVLIVLVIALIGRFWRIRAGAGLLLLPYFAWVSFALYLNAAILAMN